MTQLSVDSPFALLCSWNRPI